MPDDNTASVNTPSLADLPITITDPPALTAGDEGGALRLMANQGLSDATNVAISRTLATWTDPTPPPGCTVTNQV